MDCEYVSMVVFDRDTLDLDSLSEEEEAGVGNDVVVRHRVQWRKSPKERRDEGVDTTATEDVQNTVPVADVPLVSVVNDVEVS
jgi:hypothetical protein